MRRYETFVIIDPDISQEDRAPVLERVKELITQQDGFLVFEDIWGERKLAYEVRKKERGYYVRFDYCGLAALVNEIERFFRIDDRTLKYMTVVLDKDVDLEKVREEKAAAEKQREAESALQETQEAAASSESPPEAAASSESPPEAAASSETPPEAAATDEASGEQEPATEQEIEAADATESDAQPTPAEKKEEA